MAIPFNHLKQKKLLPLRLVDPLALAVACIISLLFANTAQQYLNTSKKNSACAKNQTVVCFQTADDPSPEDRPEAWGLEKCNAFQQQKNNNPSLPVTFNVPLDYKGRLKVYFYELSQPSAWVPSIPVAHRKLIL